MDVLDYKSTSTKIGKNIGDDLAEGNPTLPLIYAMRHGSPTEAQIIRDAISQGGRENIEAVTKAIESTGAIEYTDALARKKADLAITAVELMPSSRYKEALVGLAKFAVSRTS